MMKRFIHGVSLFFAIFLFSVTASATVLPMEGPNIYSANYDNGGMGEGRGIGFQVNQTFTMNALAIDLSVGQAETAPTYEFRIYSSPDGHTAGSLLSSTQFQLQVGTGYQDQPFNFTFSQGSYYVVSFSRADEASLGQLGTHYSWESGYVPYNYGVLTVLEGFEYANPDPGNPLVPFMRITYGAGPSAAIPTLDQWSLFALAGLLAASAIWFRRGSRRKAV